MKQFFSNLKGDKVLWAVVFILSVFSILAVYSSTGTLAYKQKGGNTEFYLLKHASILIMGWIIMYITHLIKYTYYSRISQIAIVIALPLLFLTLITGTEAHEASRWLTLPVINIDFQTSDFAKLALIMFIARMITKKQETIKDLKSTFLPMIFIVTATAVLILPANLSTAAIIFVTSLILMFVGRVSVKYIVSLLGIGLVVGTLATLILLNSPDTWRFGTWKNRVESFLGINPDSNMKYQSNQAKIAVATGGFFGKMPGNSTQRNFLPQSFSDFIYAIILEEYGFFGGVLILLLYMIILFRGIRIATRCDKIFGTVLCLGLCFMLVFQALIHMAITVGLFPVTGQPLPLISMGGTSIWFTSIGLGIMLSISRESEKETKISIPQQNENTNSISAENTNNATA